MAQLRDGHPTRLFFDNAPNIHLWVKSCTPPGIDGGGENDTTTMENERWRTRQPKVLITLTPLSANVAYDPVIYDEILSVINVNQIITVEFSDGSTVSFYGWLNSFTPGEHSEGEQPTADIEVIPSNQDNSFNEVDPNYVATGTGTP